MTQNVPATSDHQLPEAVCAFITQVIGTRLPVHNPPFCDELWTLDQILDGGIDLEHPKVGGHLRDIVMEGALYHRDIPLSECVIECDTPEVRDFVRRCWEQQHRDELLADLRVRAGQGKIPDLQKQDDPPLVEVRDFALTSRKTILAKRAAEGHRHEKSRDWDGAPEGAWDLYTRILTARAGRRSEVTIPMLGTYDSTALTWLCACEYLIQRVDDVLYVMPDRVPEWDGDDDREHPGFDGLNPRAGRSWKADESEDLALDAYLSLSARGHFPSAREVAYEINTLYDLGDHRPVSVDMIRRALKRLKDAGRLVELVPAERFRLDHAWANIPAKLGTPEDYPLAAMADRYRRRRDHALAA